MYQEHLAIASVPIQAWSEVTDAGKALSTGTIFPELDKPFYVAQTHVKEGKILSPEKTKLKQIQEISFVLDDLRLFLDTHPDNKNGLELMKEMIRERKKLLKEFALEFYPLTMDCMADIYEDNPNSECYCWQKGPVPWEGVSI